jgi:predicted nucleic acid-binding protein
MGALCRPKEALRLRLYLDACCLNRLTDDQNQDRVRNEADAVEGILRLVREGQAAWVSSTVLEIEISRNPDADRRRDVAALLAFSNEVVVPRSRAAERAAFLQKLGFGAFDALHLASAEQGQADVLLTTDDDLLRRAGRHGNELRIRVQNPVSWYREVAL